MSDHSRLTSQQVRASVTAGRAEGGGRLAPPPPPPLLSILHFLAQRRIALKSPRPPDYCSPLHSIFKGNLSLCYTVLHMLYTYVLS